MDLSVYVTTAPRKEATLGRTLQSLDDAGFRDITLSCEPGTPLPSLDQLSIMHVVHKTNRRWPWKHFLDCLHRARGDAWVMVCQDDILMASGFRDWIESQLKLLPQDVGVVSPYTASTRDVGYEGWCQYTAEELKQRRAYGACCIIMPKCSVNDLLDNQPQNASRTQTDTWISRWCYERQKSYYYFIPSLVQHIGRTSAIDDREEHFLDARRSNWCRDVKDIECQSKSEP